MSIKNSIKFYNDRLFYFEWMYVYSYEGPACWPQEGRLYLQENP